MRSKYILSLLIGLSLCFIQNIHCQTPVSDSLVNLIKKPGLHDTDKIKLYGDISWELLANNISKSLEYANKELELSTKLNRQADIAQSESDIGNIYNRKSSFDTALMHYNKALELRKQLNQDVKVAGIYTNICTIYMRQSKFDEALDLNFKSLTLFEKVGDKAKQATILCNIGNIYHELKQNVVAEKFLKQGLKLAQDVQYPAMEANILLNLGAIKYEEAVKNDIIVSTTKHDSALNYYLAAEKIMIPNNLIFNLNAAYNNIGRIYADKKDYNNAILYYQKGLKNREDLKDEYGIGLSSLNLGTVEKMKGDLDKSIEHLNKSIFIFTKLKNYINLKQAFERIAQAYEAKSDYKNSLKYSQLFAIYTDSVYNETNATKMAEMQTKYETEKKDLELEKQKAELEAKEIEKKQRETLIFSLVGLIILLVILGYFIYSKNKIKAKARIDAEIAQQRDLRSKAVIEAEEKERRRIAQDLHDGVGQILSAAKLNLSGLEDKLKLDKPEHNSLLKNALDLVNDSVKEVRAVSHNMMPNTLIKLGLASAVREFITKIGSVPNLKIDLQIIGMDERLDGTTETVLYRVIQEVVANIIKHAGANHISMQLIRHDNELTVMIEDNGKGFNSNKIHQFEGIGLKNIISRVEFLNGHVEFDSTIGQGTTVVIEVPLSSMNVQP